MSFNRYMDNSDWISIGIKNRSPLNEKFNTDLLIGFPSLEIRNAFFIGILDSCGSFFLNKKPFGNAITYLITFTIKNDMTILKILEGTLGTELNQTSNKHTLTKANYLEKRLLLLVEEFPIVTATK